MTIYLPIIFSLHHKNFHHFITEMVDDLDGEATGLRPGKGALLALPPNIFKNLLDGTGRYLATLCGIHSGFQKFFQFL